MEDIFQNLKTMRRETSKRERDEKTLSWDTD